MKKDHLIRFFYSVIKASQPVLAKNMYTTDI